MLPSNSILDIPYGRWGDPVPLGDGIHTFTYEHSATDIVHVLHRKFAGGAALLGFIHHVVGMVPQEKVVDVDAQGGVAPVENIESVGRWSVVNLPRHSVNQDEASPYSDSTVPTCSLLTSPNQTVFLCSSLLEESCVYGNEVLGGSGSIPRFHGPCVPPILEEYNG
jgi:hypothetical protein